MNYQEFSLNTVKILHEDTFNLLKEALVGEYLSFYSISEEDITPAILSEKVCDYFEKLEIKTGKNFDKQLDIFMNDLDSIINNRIVKTPTLARYSMQEYNESKYSLGRGHNCGRFGKSLKRVCQQYAKHLWK